MIYCILSAAAIVVSLGAIYYCFWRGAQKSSTQCPICEARQIETLVPRGESCPVCGWRE